MYVWIVTWRNRDPEAFYGDKRPLEILQDDLNTGRFELEDLELSATSFYVDDWCSGKLVKVSE